MEKLTYCDENNFKINTLSPNNQYYLKLQQPKEIQWGTWTCDIAFYENPEKLKYYRKGYQASKLDDDGIFVKWSKDGNCVVFNEFLLNKLCDFVFIDLALNIHYRVTWNKQEANFWKGLVDRKYQKQEVLNHLYNLKVYPRKNFLDPLQISRFGGLIKDKKWKP